MGLVYVVVGVLTEDYSFDRIEGCVTGPVSFCKLMIGQGERRGEEILG